MIDYITVIAIFIGSVTSVILAINTENFKNSGRHHFVGVVSGNTSVSKTENRGSIPRTSASLYAHSSVGLEYLATNQKVGGSSPTGRAKL